jgi:hypothetical protein
MSAVTSINSGTLLCRTGFTPAKDLRGTPPTLTFLFPEASPAMNAGYIGLLQLPVRCGCCTSSSIRHLRCIRTFGCSSPSKRHQGRVLRFNMHCRQALFSVLHRYNYRYNIYGSVSTLGVLPFLILLDLYPRSALMHHAPYGH